MTHPALLELLQSAARQPAFQDVARQLSKSLAKGGTGRISLRRADAHRQGALSQLLWMAVERPVIVVVDGAKQAEALAELLDTFFGIFARSKEAQRPLLLPALDVLPHQHLAPHPDIMAQPRGGAASAGDAARLPLPSHPRERRCFAPRLPNFTAGSRSSSPSMKRFRCRTSRII